MEGSQPVTFFGVIWIILHIIACWKIFKKAGIPGWHSIIPFVNFYDEYKICWSGGAGLIFVLAFIGVWSITPAAAEGSVFLTATAAVLAFIVVLMQIIESAKLAKAFGKGLGYTLILIFFDRLGRIMLGFGSARYIGK